ARSSARRLARARSRFRLVRERESGTESPAARRRIGCDVVPSAQVMLEKHVEDDEEVPASHLLEPQLRLAEASIRPRDREDAIRVASHDRLERELDRKVEVIREDRLNRLDHLAAIGLER